MPKQAGKLRFSLRSFLLTAIVLSLVCSHLWTSLRYRESIVELKKLRREVGYLTEPDLSKLVATRVPSDDPLTWKARVRTPALQSYQIAYSTVWPGGEIAPRWYSAQVLPEGESLITLRLLRDPRDNRWKIITLVRHEGSVWRMATALTDRQTKLFQQTHDTIRGGINAETTTAAGRSLRLIEDKWFTGEGGLMLFGQSVPDDDIDGVFAELQPLPTLPADQTERLR
ncbi:MAG: hypothetical protein R3C05_27800 [Pirellulaceae bacterium]